MRTVILLLALLFTGFTTAAQAESPYKVDGITVDVTGSSAAEAREKAMAQGEQRAFEELVQRLTAAGTFVAVQDIPPEAVGNLVQGMEVSDEKMSSNRYRATLSFDFNPDLLNQIAGKKAGFTPPQRVTETVTRTPPVLVLPLLHSGGYTWLWEEGNHWRKELDTHQKDNASKASIMLPLGDLEDVGMASANVIERAAQDSNYQLLKPLMQKYGARDVIIANATIREQGAQGSGQAALDVELTFLTPRDSKQSRASYMGLSGQQQAALLKDAAADLLKFISARNEAQQPSASAPSFVSTSPEQAIPVLVPIRDLREWQMMEQRLTQADFVKRISLKAISAHQADVLISHRSSVSDLQASLRLKGLSLNNEGGYWVLRR